MATANSFAEAVNKLDDELFVGRERELASFREWLGNDDGFPEILNVSGPSGVGKTTLLRAFRRIALAWGRPAVFVRGDAFPSTPEGLLSVLSETGTNDLPGVIARLNETRTLILMDGFDELGGLTEYLLNELLPRLETSVRFVIATRYPLGLGWTRDDLWQRLIRSMRLGGFDPAESREYLRCRGLSEPALVESVVRASAYNPLALSLAADLVVRFGVRDFDSAPEWRLVVHSLIERLLAEVRDSRLRDVLEACVAVRQFDEPTLTAITGRDDIGIAFAQLCKLSFVSPADHGLMLHEDVRRRLAEDLAWRHPDRYSALRARALAYYRERVRNAPAAAREWLVADRFFLWGNALIQDLFFSSDEPGQVWVLPGRPDDYMDIRRLYATRMEYLMASDLADGRLSQPKVDGDFFEAVMRHPSTRLRVARDRYGRTVGFSTVLPMSAETVALLDFHPAFGPLAQAYWMGAELNALPPSADLTNTWFLLHLVHGGSMPGAVRAALLRELSSIFASGGVYLCSTFVPAYKRMLEACGFDRVPLAQNSAWGPDFPVDGYVLDLSHIGVEPWIEAVMSGRRLPAPLDRRAIEDEVRAALEHWADDRWLACSRLAQLPGLAAAEGDRQSPAALRELILQALATARARASVTEEAAYRALELVYLGKRPGRKAGARDLAVSRATLYRLVRRGISGLAAALYRAEV